MCVHNLWPIMCMYYNLCYFIVMLTSFFAYITYCYILHVYVCMYVHVDLRVVLFLCVCG